MKRIGDLDVESFYKEVDFWGKRITDRLERIEDTKESIWAIHSKWRVLFYWILSIFGVVVSSSMVYMEWDKSWFEVFGVLWNSILGSVIIVWFLFQLLESIMGAYTIISEWVEKSRQERKARLKAIEGEVRQEGFREGTQKEQERILDDLKKDGATEDVLKAVESVCSSHR